MTNSDSARHDDALTSLTQVVQDIVDRPLSEVKDSVTKESRATARELSALGTRLDLITSEDEDNSLPEIARAIRRVQLALRDEDTGLDALRALTEEGRQEQSRQTQSCAHDTARIIEERSMALADRLDVVAGDLSTELRTQAAARQSESAGLGAMLSDLEARVERIEARQSQIAVEAHKRQMQTMKLVLVCVVGAWLATLVVAWHALTG